MLRGLNHSQLKTVGPIAKRLQSDNKKTFLVLVYVAMVFFVFFSPERCSEKCLTTMLSALKLKRTMVTPMTEESGCQKQ